MKVANRMVRTSAFINPLSSLGSSRLGDLVVYLNSPGQARTFSLSLLRNDKSEIWHGASRILEPGMVNNFAVRLDSSDPSYIPHDPLESEAQPLSVLAHPSTTLRHHASFDHAVPLSRKGKTDRVIEAAMAPP